MFVKFKYFDIFKHPQKYTNRAVFFTHLRVDVHANFVSCSKFFKDAQAVRQITTKGNANQQTRQYRCLVCRPRSVFYTKEEGDLHRPILKLTSRCITCCVGATTPLLPHMWVGLLSKLFLPTKRVKNREDHIDQRKPIRSAHLSHGVHLVERAQHAAPRNSADTWTPSHTRSHVIDTRVGVHHVCL